jgi:selenide,water dikinase
LAQVLRRVNSLGPTTGPDVVVGLGMSDDAGVYRMTDDLLLVQTVDFFTPIVDDAMTWGRIAAANALSDVYAMGGRPLSALSIVGWPRETLPLDLLGDVLEGGSAILAEAGCVLLGGHTIDDNEPKYGLAVTGTVHPDDLVTNDAGRPGDVLVLTKPLGTGVIATAIKRQRAPEGAKTAAVATMTTLNAGAAVAMRRIGVKAATDVTGYGLLGHLGEMMRASGVSATIETGAVPVLPDVRRLIADGVVPGGTIRNRDAARRFVDFGDTDEVDQTMLCDAQTSGGLLIAVDRPLVAALLQALADEGIEGAVIGEFRERTFADGPSGRVRVR